MCVCVPRQRVSIFGLLLLPHCQMQLSRSAFHHRVSDKGALDDFTRRPIIDRASDRSMAKTPWQRRHGSNRQVEKMERRPGMKLRRPTPPSVRSAVAYPTR